MARNGVSAQNVIATSSVEEKLCNSGPWRMLLVLDVEVSPEVTCTGDHPLSDLAQAPVKMGTHGQLSSWSRESQHKEKSK